MKKKKILITLATCAALFFSVQLNTPSVQAARGDHGVDWSVYQGAMVNGVMLEISSLSLKSVVPQLAGTCTINGLIQRK